MNKKVNKRKPSEGEMFISEYLESERISFKTEKRLSQLKGDEKKFRDADFYLTRYKVYIEFLGHWNTSERTKEEYKEKKRIYKQNKIPCVYLYPENLGIIEFLLPRRILQELRNKKMRKQLILFKLKILWSEKQNSIGYTILFFLLLAFGKFTWEEDSFLLMVFIIGAMYHIFSIFEWINRYLK